MITRLALAVFALTAMSTGSASAQNVKSGDTILLKNGFRPTFFNKYLDVARVPTASTPIGKQIPDASPAGIQLLFCLTAEKAGEKQTNWKIQKVQGAGDLMYGDRVYLLNTTNDVGYLDLASMSYTVKDNGPSPEAKKGKFGGLVFSHRPVFASATKDRKANSSQWIVRKGSGESGIVDALKAAGAKTGSVQVSLFWTNKNDLDLQVIDPSGEKIYHGNKASKSGGTLDVDMNTAHDKASKNAVENIFWAQGKAPKGRYKIIVDHYKNHGEPGCEDPTRFTVRLAVGGVTQLFQGEVVFADAKRKQVTVTEFEVDEKSNLVTAASNVAKIKAEEAKGGKVGFNDTVLFESVSAPGYLLDTNTTVGSYSSLSSIKTGDPRKQLLIFGTKGDTGSGSQLWTIEKSNLVTVASNVVKDKAEEVKIVKLLNEKGAKTGSVQVSLYWTNKNDLDLHVTEPGGDTINYDPKNKKSKSGGMLDVDMNVDVGEAKSPAVENIFWPKAPKGKYKIVVDHYRNHGLGDSKDPTAFTVRVVVGSVTQLFHGELHKNATGKQKQQAEFFFNVP